MQRQLQRPVLYHVLVITTCHRGLYPPAQNPRWSKVLLSIDDSAMIRVQMDTRGNNKAELGEQGQEELYARQFCSLVHPLTRARRSSVMAPFILGQ